MWRSKDNLRELALSLCHVGSGDRTQVVGLTASASSFGSLSLAHTWKSLTLYFPQRSIPLSGQRMSVQWGCYVLPWDSDKQGFKVISLVSGMSYPETHQEIERQVSGNMLGMWVFNVDVAWNRENISSFVGRF